MSLRKVFYDKLTGNPISTIKFDGLYRVTTFDEDYESLSFLKERIKESIGVICLENERYEQDFAESSGYRVDPETKEIEFSYPDPSEPEVEQPYQAPLSQQIEELKQENELLKARDKALSERADLIEDVVAEMATQVYQ